MLIKEYLDACGVPEATSDVQRNHRRRDSYCSDIEMSRLASSRSLPSSTFASSASSGVFSSAGRSSGDLILGDNRESESDEGSMPVEEGNM
jgi:hypothetical protein